MMVQFLYVSSSNNSDVNCYAWVTLALISSNNKNYVALISIIVCNQVIWAWPHKRCRLRYLQHPWHHKLSKNVERQQHTDTYRDIQFDYSISSDSASLFCMMFLEWRALKKIDGNTWKIRISDKYSTHCNEINRIEAYNCAALLEQLFYFTPYIYFPDQTNAVIFRKWVTYRRRMHSCWCAQDQQHREISSHKR